MTTHSHEGGFLHRRSRPVDSIDDRPALPRRSNPDILGDSGSGGPINPGDFNNFKDKDPRKRRGVLIGLGSAAATAGALVGLYLGFGGKNNTAPTPETTTSAPATTGPTAEASPSVPAETSPSIPEVSVDPTEQLLKDMDRASADVFAEKYTLDQQLTFTKSLGDEVVNEGHLHYWLTQELADKTLLGDHLPSGNPLNQFATGEAIMLQVEAQRALSFAMKYDRDTEIDYANPDAKYPLDKKTAAKVVYTLPGSPAYIKAMKNLDDPKLQFAGGMKDSEVRELRVDPKGGTSPYKDVGVEYEGQALKGKEVIVFNGSNSFKETYVALENNLYGPGTVTWLLYNSEQLTDGNK